jgi:hypothetical protein
MNAHKIAAKYGLVIARVGSEQDQVANKLKQLFESDVMNVSVLLFERVEDGTSAGSIAMDALDDADVICSLECRGSQALLVSTEQHDTASVIEAIAVAAQNRPQAQLSVRRWRDSWLVLPYKLANNVSDGSLTRSNLKEIGDKLIAALGSSSRLTRALAMFVNDDE